MNKFYTCKYDVVFKEVFLNEKNKKMLKGLLEEILKIEIEEIILEPTELNNGNIDSKRKTVDALLKTDQGIIEIEVNSNEGGYIYPRNMAYICNIYSNYTLKGEKYNDERNIVQINLTYGLGKKDKEYCRIYKIRDEEGVEFVKNLTIYELNMDKYKELWYHKDTKEYKENKRIVMLDIGKEELEKMKEDKEVKEYYESVIIVNNNPAFEEFMSEEEDKRKIYNTFKAEAEDAKKEAQKQVKEAEEKGLEEGKKEGSTKKSIEIAKNMLKDKIDIDVISKYTGLKVEEIENLK